MNHHRASVLDRTTRLRDDVTLFCTSGCRRGFALTMISTVCLHERLNSYGIIIPDSVVKGPDMMVVCLSEATRLETGWVVGPPTLRVIPEFRATEILHRTEVLSGEGRGQVIDTHLRYLLALMSCFNCAN